jgi:hypothetical protein
VVDSHKHILACREYSELDDEPHRTHRGVQFHTDAKLTGDSSGDKIGVEGEGLNNKRMGRQRAIYVRQACS